MKNLPTATLIAFGIALATNADAALLNFESIAPYPSANNVQILNYYNGGTSSVGTSGPNFGVTFGSDALLLCLNTGSTFCSNSSRGGLAPGSEFGALAELDGSVGDGIVMNVAGGFTTELSFYYALPNATAQRVRIFDGANATGELLASATLTLNAGASLCPPGVVHFCPYSSVSIPFSGIGKSVILGGFGAVTFDDIQLTLVPELSTLAMLVAGLALLSIQSIRRRKQARVRLQHAIWNQSPISGSEA